MSSGAPPPCPTRGAPMEIPLLAIVVGLGVGVVVGALGAGGGILAVPVLVFLLAQPPHAATASSLIIVLITAVFSIPHHARKKNVDWKNGLVFGAVSVAGAVVGSRLRSEEHTSELQSRGHLVCRLLLEKKKR